MGTFSKHADNELALLVKDGNVGAFAEVYDRYWAKLYNAARKRISNNGQCEELVQEVFLKYWEKRSLINISTGLSNYLHTAVKYSVIDYYRKELLKDTFIKSSQSENLSDNSNEEHVLLNDLKRLIDQSLASLPPKCRSVYQLSRVEHKTNKEIAAMLDISEKTVEGHLTNALKLLKASLGDVAVIAMAFLIR